MILQKFVRILTVLVILGMVTFPVAHLNAESTEKNSEATKDSKDVAVNVETETEFVETEDKLKEVLDKVNEAVKGIEELNTEGILDKRNIDVDVLLKKLKEHSNILKDIDGVKVEISEPILIFDSSYESEDLKELKEKIQKLVKDGNLDSDEIAKKLKELVDDMKVFKAAARDGDIVTVLQFGPNVTTKILKDTKGIKALVDKIKELTFDEDLDSDDLVKKVQDLVKEIEVDSSVVLDKDNVKVYKYGPYVSTKTLKGTKGIKELEEKIKELTSDKDLDSDELAKKVMELIKGAIPHISTEIIRGDVKVIPLTPSKSVKKVNDSEIEKLEKRIEKLETKIDKLIEKLSESEPESESSNIK